MRRSISSRVAGVEDVSGDELAHHPVVNVTWYAATAFCRWLAAYFPGARLPIEEEWEYACRAGTETRYWAGDTEEDLDRVGWYRKNSDGHTHRVGEKPGNPWKLYDMHGNVREWTATTFDDEQERVACGGSWWDAADMARSASLLITDPGNVIGLKGFRVVLPRPRAGG